MKKIVILTLLLLGLCGCTSNEKTKIIQVTCNEKDEIIEKESHAMLIDVRTKEEYELDDLGFDDYLESGVTVIEWSEKFPDRLPDDAAIVTIEKTSPTDRLFHFDFRGSRWKAVENEVKKYALSH